MSLTKVTANGIEYGSFAYPLWINSDFYINQRQKTTLADGEYGPDRTYVLAQSASVGFSVLTAPTIGIASAGRFTQSSATAQRFGFAQIMESRYVYGIRGQQFCFTPKIRTSANMKINVAILGNPSTADVLAKDVVSDWNSTSMVVGQFFRAGLQLIAMSSVTVQANTWTDVVVSGTIPDTSNNVIMFCWIDTTAAQNFTLDATMVRANVGSSPSQWAKPSLSEEFMTCQRYYEKSYGMNSPPGSSQAGSEILYYGPIGSTQLYGGCRVRYAVQKRIEPVVTPYSSTGAANRVRDARSSADLTSYNIYGNEAGYAMLITSAAVNTQMNCQWHWTAECEIGT